MFVPYWIDEYGRQHIGSRPKMIAKPLAIAYQNGAWQVIGEVLKDVAEDEIAAFIESLF